MSTACRYCSVVCLLMLLAVAAPVSAIVGGYPMPSLDDERKTYARFGWAVTGSTTQPSSFPSSTTYTVSDPAIHQDTEGDDLWMYIMQWRRTGVIGYLNRAKAWARYFRDDYRQCIPGGSGNSGTYCWDRDNHELDHVYVNGLVTFYEQTGDTSYLTAASSICSDIGNFAYTNGTPGQVNMASIFSMRGRGRQLLSVVRCAEHNASFVTLRNKLIDLWMQSPDWALRGPSGGGMYFLGQSQTDQVAGSGQYAGGLRIQGSFHIGILAEAFFHAYRTTGRTDVRDRILAIARYVSDFGLNPTTQHTGTWYGVTGAGGAYQSDEGAPYTISQVNALVFGSMFASGAEKTALQTRARTQLNRGTKYSCCPATGQGTPDNQAHHFLDTETDSSFGGFYMGHNKGELQYAWAVFLPTTDSALATAAKGLAVGSWAQITNPVSIGASLGASGSSQHKLGFAQTAVWDAGHRQIYFCGSDHPNPSSCMRYDEATNAWSVMATPPWASGVQHGYDHTAIDTVRRRVYHRPFGSTNFWNCDLSSSPICSTWTLGFTNGDFAADCCTGNHWADWKSDGVMMMLYAISPSSLGVRQWDPMTGSVTALGTVPVSGASFAECTDGAPHLCYLGTETTAFYTVNRANSVIQRAGAPCSTYEQESVPVVDPVTGHFLLGCSSTWSRFNPSTNSWNTLAGPHLPNQFVSLWSNGAVAVPVPSYGVILVVGANGGTSDASKGMWIYKNAELLGGQSAGAGDTTPPAPPFLRP